MQPASPARCSNTLWTACRPWRLLQLGWSSTLWSWSRKPSKANAPMSVDMQYCSSRAKGSVYISLCRAGRANFLSLSVHKYCPRKQVNSRTPCLEILTYVCMNLHLRNKICARERYLTILVASGTLLRLNRWPPVFVENQHVLFGCLQTLHLTWSKSSSFAGLAELPLGQSV